MRFAPSETRAGERATRQGAGRVFRCLLRVLLAFAIGAGITWFTAWACTVIPATAYRFEWELTGWYIDRNGRRVDVHFVAVQGASPQEGSRFAVGSSQQAEQMWTEMRSRPDIVFTHQEEQTGKFGFPCHALAYDSLSVKQRIAPNAQLRYWFTLRHALTVSQAAARRWHWPWGAPGRGDFRLPMRILPSGFAVDALFYGMAVFILFAAPALVRRRLRQRRGLCLTCGYNLTGNVTGRCPECGIRFVSPDLPGDRR